MRPLKVNRIFKPLKKPFFYIKKMNWNQKKKKSYTTVE